MKKAKKILIYVTAVIISFLIIPEIVLRTVSTDNMGRLSELTSLGGLFSPFLSLMVFFALSSIFIAIIGVYAVDKIYRALTRVKRE
ncbi:hypothetical protein AAEY27_03250 [Kosakonia sp. BYX6]|uniref:Uncharacterized protein n=1 Tax=Kosakonia calanthes TaxID=3139408 RepID=A0ABZ3B6X3_9ENTR